jgi:hypothetical protein
MHTGTPGIWELAPFKTCFELVVFVEDVITC